ncbi:hypothetical protein YC2023_118386 [Brassica napus]
MKTSLKNRNYGARRKSRSTVRIIINQSYKMVYSPKATISKKATTRTPSSALSSPSVYPNASAVWSSSSSGVHFLTCTELNSRLSERFKCPQNVNDAGKQKSMLTRSIRISLLRALASSNSSTKRTTSESRVLYGKRLLQRRFKELRNFPCKVSSGLILLSQNHNIMFTKQR